MDNLKDTEKTDGISRFLDSHTVRTNPFGDNRAAERAYRRAERMVAALYLLTNHIPATEPIKTEIREQANRLLAEVLVLRDEMRSPQSGGVQAVLSRVRQLISLVRILTVSGHVSIQNSGTMIEAFDDLGNFLTASQRSILSENVTLTREDLLDVSTGPVPVRSTVTAANREPGTPTSLKDNGTIKDRGSAVERPTGARSHQIIEILRTGGSLGIRDIAANLPEYGEKTIQRELLALVDKGIVRKIGLKRWSRYTLAL